MIVVCNFVIDLVFDIGLRDGTVNKVGAGGAEFCQLVCLFIAPKSRVSSNPTDCYFVVVC